MTSKEKTLTRVNLQDVTNKKLYTLLVTPDEAKRVETDMMFATQLLHEAINNDNKEPIDENIENESVSLEVKGEETEGYKWPYEAILLLIEEFSLREKDCTSGKISKKKLWSLISTEMIRHGHNVTGPQCLSKFSGLKRTYKSIQDHNNKSGNGRKTWPYFSLMDNLLGSKPYMSPVSTVSSTGKRSHSESSLSTDDVDMIEKPQCKKARLTSVEKIIFDLKDERKMLEEATERRHRENVEQRDRLLNTFERMLSILERK